MDSNSSKCDKHTALNSWSPNTSTVSISALLNGSPEEKKCVIDCIQAAKDDKIRSHLSVASRVPPSVRQVQKHWRKICLKLDFQRILHDYCGNTDSTLNSKSEQKRKKVLHHPKYDPLLHCAPR